MTEWAPATDAEVAMRDALRTDDQESYFRILAGVDLLLPVSADALAGLAPLGWGTWSTGGRTHVLAFTSPSALQACLADYTGSARRVPYAELADTWPNLEWWLAVNPGLPIEGYLPAWFVAQLSRGDLRLPTRGPAREGAAGAPRSPQDRQAAAMAANAAAYGGGPGQGGPASGDAAEAESARFAGPTGGSGFGGASGMPAAAAAAGASAQPGDDQRRDAAAAYGYGNASYGGPAASPSGVPAGFQGAGDASSGGQAGGAAAAFGSRGGQQPSVGPGGLPVRTAGAVLPSGLPSRVPTSSASQDPSSFPGFSTRAADGAAAPTSAAPGSAAPSSSAPSSGVPAAYRPPGVPGTAPSSGAPGSQSPAGQPTGDPGAQAYAGQGFAGPGGQGFAGQGGQGIAGPGAQGFAGQGGEGNAGQGGQGFAGQGGQGNAGKGEQGFAAQGATGQQPEGQSGAAQSGQSPASLQHPRRPLPTRTPMAQTPPLPSHIPPPEEREAAPGSDSGLPRRAPSSVAAAAQAFAGGRATGPAGTPTTATPPSTTPPATAGPIMLPVIPGAGGPARGSTTPPPTVPAAATRPVVPPSTPPQPDTTPADGGADAEDVFVPANDVERELLDAADEGSTDRFLSTLLLATVLVPVAQNSQPDSSPGESGFAFRTEEIDGERFLVVFTSRDRLAEHFSEPTRTVGVRFYELIRNWPDPAWSFAVNPESPVGAKYPGPQVIALASWAADAGLGADPAEVEERAVTPLPAPQKVSDAAQHATVMQKTVPPDQVHYYLERGYDRVAGFVHRANEVEHLRTPGELFAALGLVHDGSPFKADAAEAYVLRWPAYRPSLYRIPYGGQSEQALRAMDGWVIERPPFRGNGFAPGEGRDVIAEFKVDSVRLPHGAQLWRMDADGTEKMVAIFDCDAPVWRRVGEQ